jgi:hypothetical protein
MTKDPIDATSSFEALLLGADAEGAADAIAKAGDRGAELVDAWVRTKNAAAVFAVAGDDRTQPPARRAARRGLNVLKARGVPIPERTHVARIAGDAIEGYEAWLVPPDASGTSIVIVASRRASGKYRIVHAILRDGVGLLEVRPGELSRSQLKAAFEDSAKRLGYAPASIPVDWARARIAAAKLDNPKSGAVLPLGLDTQADLLGPAPDPPPRHPIDAESLELPPQADAVMASATLHREPEFATWLPNGQALEQLLSDIGKGMASAGGPEPDPAKVDGIISGAIDAATDRFFEPELRRIVAARMKDAAISILARAGKERAAEVLRIAEATVAAGLITSPPHEIPFLRGFFQKALAILAERSGGQLSIPVPTAPSDVDLLSPDLEAPAPHEKVSAGGIILP